MADRRVAKADSVRCGDLRAVELAGWAASSGYGGVDRGPVRSSRAALPSRGIAVDGASCRGLELLEGAERLSSCCKCEVMSVASIMSAWDFNQGRTSVGFFKRVFAQRREWLNVIKENRADIKAHLRTGNEGEIVVFSDKILKRQGALGEMHPLAGVVASVENVGGVSARTTLTRAATVGGGWQKENDDRQMFLSVEGPEFSWLVDISPKSDLLRSQLITAARQFVAQTNLTARKLSVSTDPEGEGQVPS